MEYKLLYEITLNNHFTRLSIDSPSQPPAPTPPRQLREHLVPIQDNGQPAEQALCGFVPASDDTRPGVGIWADQHPGQGTHIPCLACQGKRNSAHDSGGSR